MDASRTIPFYAPQWRSGVFVRRRRTYVTRRNEMHIQYRQTPLYHPYTRRVPERVDWKSTVITTTVDEDVFVPYHSNFAKIGNDQPNVQIPQGVQTHPECTSHPGLVAHPELSREQQVKSEDQPAVIKPEPRDPFMPNEYRLRQTQWNSVPGSTTNYIGDMDPGKREEGKPFVDRATPAQSYTQSHQRDERVPRVKSEPVD